MATEISALLLDIGGVLLSNGWDRKTRRKAAEVFGLDWDDMDERHHLTFDTYEEGKLSLEEYLNRLVFFKPRSFTLEDFRRYMFAQSQPYPQMIDLVRKLSRLYHLRIGTVSNDGRELTLHRIRTFHLEEFVHFFVSSCFVHIRKPDEEIWRIALDISQVPKERVVYIDDRPLFVEVARGIGIRGLVHTSYENTRAALAEMGLVVPQEVPA